jgi:glycosyltransferase involved in cell wall biosynthesis
MGAKMPIACSDKTGLSEILKDAGIYFNPEDTLSIINALMTLLDDKNLRKILGEKAYKYASEYTWEKCAVNTFNYIKEVYEKY